MELARVLREKLEAVFPDHRGRYDYPPEPPRDDERGPANPEG